MPLGGAEALRRARGAGRLRVVPVVRTRGQFDYRNKNYGTNIVMSIAVPSSELIAAASEYPCDTHAVFSRSALQ
jgi:hypothetical protein